MDELKTKIESAIAEEKADIEKYCRLIDLAEEHGHYKVAGVLRDIKHDEETHVLHLQSICNWVT